MPRNQTSFKRWLFEACFLAFLKSLRTLSSTNCYCAPYFIRQSAARCRGTAQRVNQLIPPHSLSKPNQSSPPWFSLEALCRAVLGIRELPDMANCSETRAERAPWPCPVVPGWLHGGHVCPEPAAPSADHGSITGQATDLQVHAFGN